MTSLSSSVSPAWRAIITTMEDAEACVQRWVVGSRMTKEQQERICEQWRTRRESWILKANADAPVPELWDMYPFDSGEGSTVRGNDYGLSMAIQSDAKFLAHHSSPHPLNP